MSKVLHVLPVAAFSICSICCAVLSHYFYNTVFKVVFFLLWKLLLETINCVALRNCTPKPSNSRLLSLHKKNLFLVKNDVMKILIWACLGFCGLLKPVRPHTGLSEAFLKLVNVCAIYLSTFLYV